MYSLTLFKNRYDNKTHKTMSFETWDEFVSLLFMLSEKPDTKATAPLISPATYEEGTTRSNKNVDLWGKWAAIDVDDIDIPADRLREVLVERFSHWDFVCYSTASSTVDRPKFRLVFNLMETVHKDLIPKFWWALNTEVGDIGDRQAKDLSRMYYVPAKYDGAHNFIFRNAGRPIDVDYLVVKHPYKEKEGKNFLDRLPDDLQKAVIEHRKGQMENTGFLDYRIPVCSDLPMIETVIVEEPNPRHPYGVRGIGETPIIPPMAAIANAVSRAMDVRFSELPMSPPKVLARLEEAKMAAE